jgi:hypothetical protein
MGFNGTRFLPLIRLLGSAHTSRAIGNPASSFCTVVSQYTYDPYGNQTTVSGTASDIGYAGYFTHVVNGPDLTLYRAYDPTHARWWYRN